VFIIWQKYRKISKYFGQTKCDEQENAISVGFEVHFVMIWHKNILQNIKILKSHNFADLKYLCNQSMDFDETAIKLLRTFYLSPYMWASINSELGEPGEL
jgi:hypothetical protein